MLKLILINITNGILLKLLKDNIRKFDFIYTKRFGIVMIKFFFLLPKSSFKNPYQTPTLQKYIGKEKLSQQKPIYADQTNFHQQKPSTPHPKFNILIAKSSK